MLLRHWLKPDLYLALADDVCVRDGDRERVGVRDDVRDAVPVTLARGLCVGDLLAVRVAVGVRLLVDSADGLRDEVGRGVEDRDGVSVDGVIVGAPVADATDGVAGRLGVNSGVSAALADDVPEAVGVRKPLCVTVRVPLGALVRLLVTADEALNELELEPELLADALDVPLGSGVCDAALVPVLDGDAEPVPVSLPWRDGERDRLPLRVPVCVGRAESVADPDADEDADGDAVAEAVSEGVREPVAEPVSVRVPVDVGVDHWRTLETAISAYGLQLRCVGFDRVAHSRRAAVCEYLARLSLHAEWSALISLVLPWIPNVPRHEVARRVSLREQQRASGHATSILAPREIRRANGAP